MPNCISRLVDWSCGRKGQGQLVERQALVWSALGQLRTNLVPLGDARYWGQTRHLSQNVRKAWLSRLGSDGVMRSALSQEQTKRDSFTLVPLPSGGRVAHSR